MNQRPSSAPLLTTREAAEHLSLAEATLEKWRSISNRTDEAKGPRFLRLEGAVRYRLSDLEEFIAESETEASSP